MKSNASKKNLVFIITKSEIGGAQKWVSEQHILLRDEYNIFLITSDKGWLTTKFSHSQVFIVPGLKDIKNLANIFSVAKVLRKIGANIVVSNSANAGFYGRLAKILHRHRSIYVSHGWSCIYNGGRAKKAYCFIEKLMSYFSDSILCVSKNDQVNAIKIIGIHENKLQVIKNSTLPLEKKDIHTNYHERAIKLVFVGRMTHPKIPALLAEAISYKKEVIATFIGDGEYLSDLKIKYEKFDNILFLGEVSNFNDYKSYDVFILTSESEGLPMSAIEAGVSGLPLIMSDVGGCKELIHEFNGFFNGIVINNTVESLSLAIEEIIDNYDSYATAAYNLVHEFDINTKKNKYISLYGI
ncbi:glycosyltransferase [Siccibacter colletis]|uniref:glycosyltransferase n=1 Tax=Siccibacter colletis TaxID=1505757 RepID=UPI0028BD9165|nr:glycosyltransferase [Siccibacter colletis]WNN47296.1 glycosyltransferase [Siccibacter colletis]